MNMNCERTLCWLGAGSWRGKQRQVKGTVIEGEESQMGPKAQRLVCQVN